MALETSSEQIQHIPIELIIAKPQVRKSFDEELQVGTTVSLKEVGQLQPIRVRQEGKKFVIVDGERRYRSIRELGWPTIAAIVEVDGLSEVEIVQRQLISNCLRQELTASEKGAAISQLMVATGWNASEVAAKLGMSSATATKFMAILSLPEDIQLLVNEGKIPASAAYELSRVGDREEQTVLANRLASGTLTRDGLIGVCKAARHKSGPKPSKASNRATAVLSAGRSVTVAAPALDLEAFIVALEEILTRARRMRPQGVALSTFLEMCKDQLKSPQVS